MFKSALSKFCLKNLHINKKEYHDLRKRMYFRRIKYDLAGARTKKYSVKIKDICTLIFYKLG